MKQERAAARSGPSTSTTTLVTGGRPLEGERAAIREQLGKYRDAALEYLVAGLPRTGTEDEAVRALEDVVRALEAA